MSIYLIISLIIFGIFLLAVEFLIIPGITIAGIFGTLLILGGVISAYYYTQPMTATVVTIGTACVIVLFFVLVFKTKTWQRFGLKSAISGHASEDVAEIFKVGDTGKSISRLAPIGRVMINEKIAEARSLGGYIDPNTEIIITRTEKNKLFVEPKNKN